MANTDINAPSSMNMLDAVKVCFKKYFVMKGRARRAEFWWFYLFTFLLSIVTALIDTFVLGFTFEDTGPLNTITSLAVLIPTIAATVRRLHDTGRSGWYFFVPILGAVIGAVLMVISGGAIALIVIGVLIILAGIVLQIVWLCQASEPGTNQYGPNPIDGLNREDIAEVFE